MGFTARLGAAAYLLKRLVLKGDDQRFAPSGSPVRRPAAPPELGRVDDVEVHTLRGWARRLDDPEALVRVDVYLDEEFLGRAPCNLPRHDLSQLPGFHKSGRHGFEFPLPDRARRLGGRLRVVAADSGLELSGSPIDLGEGAADIASADLSELLSKVWYSPTPAGGVVCLAQIQAAYGRRLAILAEIDPEARDAAWPVTRAMSYVNARNHEGRLPFHGAEAYVGLLTTAGAHFASARAGLPMDRRQVEALAAPTHSLLAGRVQSNMLLDVFAKTRAVDRGHDEASVADLLARFVFEVLAPNRLPIELLGDSARVFLRQRVAEGGETRFEQAFARLSFFAGLAHASDSKLAATALRLAASDLGLLDLISAARAVAPAPRPPAPLRRGVRIVTGDHGDSGLTLNARNSVAALRLIGVETEVSVAPLASPATLARYDALDAPPFATALLHLPPHDAVEVILRLPPGQARAKLIGFYMWETEGLPQAHQLGALLVDEIWTASRFCEQVFRLAAPKTPVHVVGHAVQLAEPAVDFDARPWAGVREEDFVFLFHFDAHSWITRKNPTGVVRAFRRAFAPEETDVRLIIKVRRAEDAGLPQWKGWWDEFYEEAARDDRVVVMQDDLSPARMSALARSADAFVSLHRGEGFGYGVAEAMLAGKPVIATAYSGTLDYASSAEALLIQAVRRPVRTGEFLYAGPAQVWAEPDLDQAARAMRTIRADKRLAEQLGRRGCERVRRDCALAALAARYDRALGLRAAPTRPQTAA
jgi:glycosyltransferase involved in cell wall biosynthesis